MSGLITLQATNERPFKFWQNFDASFLTLFLSKRQPKVNVIKFTYLNNFKWKKKQCNKLIIKLAMSVNVIDF